MTDHYEGQSYDEIIKAIRRVIKKAVNDVSVRKGRGTARSWIEITVRGGESFTDIERKKLEALGFNPYANGVDIGPHARRFWYERLVLGQHEGENEPAGSWD